jgi:hypothetical protein
MKKIGIVADNYKLARFKKELGKAGFTDFDVVPFTEGTSTIKVNTPENRIADVKRICQSVELHFKRSN